jgi:hypothetical protein
MTERTEGAALSGTLTVVIDGRARTLPVLKLKQSREWKERLGGVAAGIEVDDDLAVTIGRAANLASDVALDLLVAYDRTDVLGGRDAIEEQATDAEVFAALESLVKVTYPFETVARSLVEAFGPQLRTMATGLLGNVAANLMKGSSTPTPNVIGDSTPTPSRRGTRTNSSSSSSPMTSAPSSSAPRLTAT